MIYDTVLAFQFDSFLQTVDVYSTENRLQKLQLSSTIYIAAHTTGESVILAITLLTIQSFRRLYECLFINVDSGSKMNLLHYIVGYVHYYCAAAGIFCEAPGLFHVLVCH